MKKQYIVPNIIMVATESQSILAGADKIDVNSSTTFDGISALSKKHTFTCDNLWDETWEDPEEEDQ
ncbi:hypothetical protein [Prevotella sp.]|uniref:hypothetical protein n=1 Tax=Prevotella sp. TaxID=59823 RepID=UPI00307B5407